MPGDEIAHRLAPADFLRIVGGEADAAQHRGDAVAEMRHMHDERGMRSNTPLLINRIVAMISENSRPTERAVSQASNCCDRAENQLFIDCRRGHPY
ncbi:MAG: hypothetical protein HY244_04595 [Rhizobiales bacterium]|nr:hypothetical protein [Hyphomicrobiales bacterium]